MTEARENLRAAAEKRWQEAQRDNEWHGYDDEILGLLDAFLAHPDDLIALLVERGALEQVGWRPVGSTQLYRDRIETFPGEDGEVYPVTVAWEPVYGQVREEAP